MKFNNESENISELHELVNLAEKTSESARNYSDKISRIYIVLAFSFFLLFGIIGSFFLYDFFMLTVQSQLILGVSIVFLFSFSFMIFTLQFSRYKRLLAVEKDILYRLLEMISELMDLNVNKGSLSIVETAILEMRLKRIQFNFRRKNHYENRL